MMQISLAEFEGIEPGHSLVFGPLFPKLDATADLVMICLPDDPAKPGKDFVMVWQGISLGVWHLRIEGGEVTWAFT